MIQFLLFSCILAYNQYFYNKIFIICVLTTDFHFSQKNSYAFFVKLELYLTPIATSIAFSAPPPHPIPNYSGMFYHISSLLISQVKISFNYFNRYVLGGITRLWSSLTDPRRKKKTLKIIPKSNIFTVL